MEQGGATQGSARALPPGSGPFSQTRRSSHHPCSSTPSHRGQKSKENLHPRVLWTQQAGCFHDVEHVNDVLLLDHLTHAADGTEGPAAASPISKHRGKDAEYSVDDVLVDVCGDELHLDGPIAPGGLLRTGTKWKSQEEEG
uniref:Uncharacterized protein n=1 Tax=Myotis myotis TaxID=51298 RepID=A0A7J7VZ23_MYOMY|nr:hypothetical protein mMyoMyo1_012242 [Myotis myotis]